MSHAATADAATLAAYDAGASDYAVRMRPPDDAPPLTRFLALLPEGGRVLDWGCGAGWASAAMMRAGMSVRAVDASPGLVAEARALGVPAEIGAFEALDETAAFDGVWASFSLLHAPRAALPGLLGRARRALRPGGALYLGLKLGAGEARDRLGRRYAYWSEAELRALLPAAGLTVLGAERTEEPGWAGAVEPAIHVFARG